MYLLPSILPTPITYDPSTSTSSPASTSTPHPVILKHRFPKTYRHPTLNASLTKTRLAYEARALSRCLRAGVSVPAVIWVDEAGGTLGLERIDGWSVREILGGGAEGEIEVIDEEEVEIHPKPTPTPTTGNGEAGTEVVEGVSEEMQGLQVNGAEGVEPVGAEEDSEGLIKLRTAGVTPGTYISSPTE